MVAKYKLCCFPSAARSCARPGLGGGAGGDMTRLHGQVMFLQRAVALEAG